MKKILKILSALSVLLLSIIVVGCGSPDEILFTKDNTPRQTYVQGQELDFTDIVLTSQKKDKTEDIPMDSEDISVSGYNKDTLGEQTVTVTYKDVSTSFKVTVIPRMTVEGFTENYFVGDTFNNQNGKVRVANDKAEITTVNLKDAGVTVTGFDSATAGAKTLTVSYGGYTGSFTVNILDVEDISLKKPSYNIYLSHETEFNTSGAYFTVKSTGGIIEKTVPLTIDMVTDFDPSVATIENNTTANYKEQIVKITYLNKTFDFKIYIRYSGVSIVRQRANEMKNVDYTATIDPTIGNNAIDAMNEYFALSDDHRALISEEDKNTVARVAASYGYAEFLKEIDKYSNTFGLNPGESTDSNGKFVEYCGYFTISCEKYEYMAAVLEVFEDSKSRLVTLGNVLHKLESNFKTLEMSEGTNLDKYFEKLYLQADFDYVSLLFQQMTSIYEALMVVPTDWTKDSIKDPDIVKGIERAYSRIKSSDFYFLDYPEFYNMISRWRDKNDFYDIIHTHYLYNYEYDTNAGENYTAFVWEKVPFPHEINNIYNTIAHGFNYGAYMSSRVFDTTTFMTIYRNAIKAANAIKDGDNEFYKQIYNEIGFDKLINDYLYTGIIRNSDNSIAQEFYAYLKVAGDFIYSDSFDLLWNDYFAIVDLADEEGVIKFDDEATKAAIVKMFNDFYSVTDFDRFQFICTLYSNYKEYKVDGYAFDSKDGGTGTFAQILLGFFTGEDAVLSDESCEIFKKMLIATEQYGIRYKNISDSMEATEKFIALMKEIVDAYIALDDSEQDLFDATVGVAYDTLLATYNALTATAPEIDSIPELKEIKTVLLAYLEIRDAILEDSKTANDLGYYALLFSAYEKACEKVESVLSSDNDTLIKAFHYYAYIVMNTEDEDDKNDYAKTLEAVFNMLLVNSKSYTITVTASDGTKTTHDPVDYYTAAGFDGFLEAAYDILYAYFSGNISEVSASAIASLAEDVRDLLENSDALNMFYSLNVDNIYYNAVKAYYADNAIAAAIFDAEVAYAKYVTELNDEDESGSTDDADALAAFITAFEDVTAPTDDTLLTIYNFYLEKYNSLKTAD